MENFNFSKIKIEFEVIANSILKENGVLVSVDVNDLCESYTYMKNPKYGVIQIGLGTLPQDEGFSLMNRLRAQGLLYHEIGHLLYTQFEPMGVIKEKEIQAKKGVEKLAISKKEELKSWDLQVCSDLKSSIKENIFWHEMGPVLNMLEDAVVEVLMPSSTPYKRNKDKIFASISAMRDYQYSEKDENLLKSYCYDIKKDDSELLKMALYEVHQFGVIGYRTTTSISALQEAVKPEDIEELKALAFQSKFMTSNTAERYSIAKLILKKFDALLNKKADKFFDSLMEAVNMSEVDIENAINSMSAGAAELSITMPNQTASGSSSQESEFNYDLSEEQKKGIDQQKEEDSKELNGEYKEDTSQQGETSENSNSSESSDDGENTSNSSNSSSDEQRNSKNSSKNGDSDGFDEKTSEDSNSATEENDSNDKSSSNDSSKKALPSMEELNREVQKAVDGELEKEASKDEKNESQSLEKSVKNYQKNTQKRKGETYTLEDYNTDFHKGIKTICENISNTDVDGFSFEGKTVYSQKDNFLPEIRRCANKINKIKMYSAKAKRLNAQRKGKLNTSGLYRIGIDQKVFQKTNPGKKQNFRIAFLIDESGSMDGQKMRNAIQTAYILASACRYVKVPVSIWGHNIFYDDSMNLKKYLGFEDKSPKSLDKVFNATPGGCNHDGLAIWHVAKDLVAHRKNDEKLLLFVLSDGAPNGAGKYYGEPAEKDISHIVSLFKKQYEVESFGITIETSDYEVEACKRIYGDNAIYISNSKDLPKKTIELLESLYK